MKAPGGESSEPVQRSRSGRASGGWVDAGRGRVAGGLPRIQPASITPSPPLSAQGQLGQANSAGEQKAASFRSQSDYSTAPSPSKYHLTDRCAFHFLARVVLDPGRAGLGVNEVSFWGDVGWRGSKAGRAGLAVSTLASGRRERSRVDGGPQDEDGRLLALDGDDECLDGLRVRSA